MSTNQNQMNDEERNKKFKDEKKERKTRTDCAMCVELTQLYNDLFCSNCEKEEKKRLKESGHRPMVGYREEKKE